jgi:hypothetical protein
MRPVAPIERAEALSTFLSLANSATNSAGLPFGETLPLDLVQKLEVLWSDEASREALCSLGGDQAQKMVDVLQQVRLFYFVFAVLEPLSLALRSDSYPPSIPPLHDIFPPQTLYAEHDPSIRPLRP